MAELVLVGPPFYLPRSPSVEKANDLSRNEVQGNRLLISLVCPTHPHLPTPKGHSERLLWGGMSRTELISTTSGFGLHNAGHAGHAEDGHNVPSLWAMREKTDLLHLWERALPRMFLGGSGGFSLG